MSDYWGDFAKYARPDTVSGEEKGIMNQTGQMLDNLQVTRQLLERVDQTQFNTTEAIGTTEGTISLAVAYALADIADSLRTQLRMWDRTGTGFSAQR